MVPSHLTGPGNVPSPAILVGSCPLPGAGPHALAPQADRRPGRVQGPGSGHRSVRQHRPQTMRSLVPPGHDCLPIVNWLTTKCFDSGHIYCRQVRSGRGRDEESCGSGTPPVPAAVSLFPRVSGGGGAGQTARPATPAPLGTAARRRARAFLREGPVTVSRARVPLCLTRGPSACSSADLYRARLVERYADPLDAADDRRDHPASIALVHELRTGRRTAGPGAGQAVTPADSPLP